MESSVVGCLVDSYALGNVDRAALIKSYADNLCGGNGLTKEQLLTVTKAKALSDFLSIDGYKGVLHSVLKVTIQRKRRTVTVKYDNDVFDANEDAQSNMMLF